MPDYIHVCLSIVPKFSVAHAHVIGFLKGKSAVLVHREVLKAKRVTGLYVWARGYCVSTVGLDEDTIRKYVREQEKREKVQLDIDFEK
jgi:putative transposase